METDKSHNTGVFLCLLSASGFATLVIFGRLAYEAQLSLPASLAWRFGGASLMLWVFLFWRGMPASKRRDLVLAFLLGAIGYAGQAGLFFAALQRVGVALTSLLLYLYPALVTLLVWIFRGERPSRARIVALILSLLGCALVLNTPGGFSLSSGVLFGLASALWYASYLTFGFRLVESVDPWVTTTFVCSGAAFSFLIIAAGGGTLTLPTTISGWVSVAGLAILATVLPILTLFAGIQKVGAAHASLISSVEPLLSVALAYLIFGETLSLLQSVGGLVILTAITLTALEKQGKR